MVYILDAAANNPGAAGGALVNWRGELVGVLGKELRNRTSGAWLHYALPAREIAEVVENLREGRSLERAPEAAAPLEPLTLASLGIVLVPDVVERTPPYIDSVASNSPAAQAKLRPDDLVVFVEGEPTASRKAVVDAIGRREKFDEVRLSVLRRGKLLEVTLSAEDLEAERDESNVEPSSPSDEE
jgi:serine protease Do